MSAPCCGQTWSDPKVPHFCNLMDEANKIPNAPSETKVNKSSLSTVSGTANTPSRKGQSENIQVFIRIRPLIDRETGLDPAAQHFIRATSDQTIEVQTSESNIKCKYDAVFGPSVSQDDVYDRVKDCTEAFLNGFNSTLFAYGQTGSGKSFTMFGAESDLSRFRPGLTKSQAGIIPRAIKDIFAGLITMNASGKQQSALFCSFVQIYNENIYDLLRDVNMDRPLAIHEDRMNGIYVEGLSEYAVQNVHDCLSLLQAGEENRAVRSTHMNQVSSRSHSAFQLFLETKRKDGTTIKSKFNLVDLAGSEKWHPDANMQYYHISEMTNINLSLHTLGRCIAALTTKTNNHVPYRDSKLTRLLQDSLGGNTKTRIIATLSPAVDCIEESISTLKFADRAKQVMVCVRVNEQREIDPAYVEKLEQEVADLRAIVSSLDQNSSPNSETETNKTGESQLARLLKENADLKEQNMKLRRQLDEQPTRACPIRPSDASAVSSAIDDGNRCSNQNHQALETIVMRLKDASERFFKFEIEEDELKDIMETSFKLIHQKGGAPITPLGRPSLGFSRPRAKGALNDYVIPGARPVVIAKSAEVAFRVRGKANQADSWQTDAPQKKSEEDEIKAAEKAMKKQAKLQAWLLEKERRELAKLQQQHEYIDEQRKAQAEKDAKFYKRALETKKKLSQATPEV
ncbi:hypothetical protein AC1031_006243 [Aphanomyces cochlioides]|nr:hypothetical protein AC1031_006243 [Aphanomyces cochlioides]